MHTGGQTESLEGKRAEQRAAAAADKALESVQSAKQAVKKPVEDPKGTKEAAKERAGKLRLVLCIKPCLFRLAETVCPACHDYCLLSFGGLVSQS